MKNCYKIVASLAVLCLVTTSVFGQSAALDVESNSQGFLLPRMTENNRDLIVDPAHALIIYQTDGVSGFYYNQGTTGSPDWRRLSTASTGDCESRIPIDALPFSIIAPGSFYVTADLTATANSDGITISASNVTIDLNGYTLHGGGGTDGNGIIVSVVSENITIKNGGIKDWPETGVAANLATASRFSSLQLSDNQLDGLFVGDNNIVSNCQSTNNNFDGIDAGDNCTISNCVVSTNQDDGLECDASCVVAFCTSYFNTDNGVNVGTGTTLSDNISRQNGDRGFVIGNGSVARGNSATSNSNEGFDLGSGCQVQQNVSRANTSHGFESAQDSYLLENTADNNGGAGFFTSASKVRLENNQSTSNTTYGFDVQGFGDCVIIRNSAINNSPSNYIIGPGNSAGPIIGSSLTTTNPFANIGL